MTKHPTAASASPSRPKAYSYLRFSTPEQSKGDSTRRQSTLAQEYATRHGLDLDTELTFHDLGVSAFRGKNAEEGRLADFLEAVRAEQVPRGSYLLVEALDRLSRLAPRRALRVLEAIADEGITVVTLNDQREYTKEALDRDPMGLLTAIIVFMRANEESVTKARRLRAAWEAKRVQAGAKPLTAVVPAWLQLNKAAGRIEPIPERVAIVRRIFAEYAAGFGQHAIAERLNADGVACFGRAAFWHRSYIIKVLDNVATYGVYVPHTYQDADGKRVRLPLDPVPGYYPAAVSEEAFNEVASMRGERTAPKHRANKVVNLVAGLAQCASCGSAMTRVNKGDPRKAGKPKLVCTRAKAGAGCEYRSVDLDMVETSLVANASILVATAPSHDGQLDADLTQVLDNLDALQEAMANLMQALEEGTSRALTARLRDLEAEQLAMEHERDALLERVTSGASKVLDKHLKALEEALTATPVQRPEANAALRKVLSAIVVDPARGALTLQWKHGGESEVMFRWQQA